MNYRLLICLALIAVFSACDHRPARKEPTLVVKDTAKALKADAISPVKDSLITIAAVGDIMLGSSYPDSTGLPPDDAKGTFKYVIKDLKDADIAFANLEGVLLDTGAPVNYKLKFKHAPYLFRMPERYGSVIKDAGFNLISVGNNHSNDFDLAGRKSTAKVLDSLGIPFAGFKSHPSKEFVIKDIKYGFCAFSPNAQTVSLLQVKNAQKIISQLKSNNDVVIVSFHGGGEGVGYEHVKDSVELFKGENRGDLVKFSHAAIDAGADLVIGHGPHVTRAMELYKNRLIAYSLGNFATYKGVSVSGICGFAPLLKVKLNKKGEFVTGQITSFLQDHFAGVKPDTLYRAAKKIKLLTETDFLQPGINISDAGAITRVH